MEIIMAVHVDRVWVGIYFWAACFEASNWNLIWWCSMPWSRSLYQMALIGHFFVCSFAFRCCHWSPYEIIHTCLESIRPQWHQKWSKPFVRYIFYMHEESKFGSGWCQMAEAIVLRIFCNIPLHTQFRLSQAYSIDVYRIPQWWPFHPFETTFDQLRKDFMAILDSRNPKKRKHYLQAYLHGHADLLKASSIDSDDFYDYLSHSLPDMLVE